MLFCDKFVNFGNGIVEERDLESAAKKLIEKGMEVNRSSLAKESGFSRQALSKGYLKEPADKLIEQWGKVPNSNLEWPYEVLREKYDKLLERIATLEKKNKENTEALKRERLKSHDLEDQLELLRGEIYQQDIKYRI